MNQQIIDLLERLRNKGAVSHTKDIADSIMNKLRSFLKEDEYFNLHISIEHYRLGEGAAEFYEVINNIISKYNQPNNDLPKKEKTLL